MKPADNYTSNVDKSGHKMAEQMKLLRKVGHINDQCKCVKLVRVSTPLAFHTYLCSTQGQACPCFCAKWQGGWNKRDVSTEMGGEGQVQVFSNGCSCREQELRVLAVCWGVKKVNIYCIKRLVFCKITFICSARLLCFAQAVMVDDADRTISYVL